MRGLPLDGRACVRQGLRHDATRGRTRSVATELFEARVVIGVSPYWIQAVQGVLILITVLADIVRRRRQIRSIRT